MTNKLFGPVLLVSLVLSLNGFAQSINATLGGTVRDVTGAFIPGVTVTATNTGTGIVTEVLTNESGVYQFASLQPGTYDIEADLPGFQSAVVRGFQLSGAQQARFNFALQVGTVAQAIEVTTQADTLLATTSSSVGNVLPEYRVRDLPLATRNVLGLVSATAGVQSSGSFIGNIAGGRLSAANTMRDGMNVTDGRFENGAFSVTYTSPDLVEEVSIVVGPVDAQTSRGSGQISMVTRSGTNDFRGSVFWINQNSALDAANWFDNFSGVEKSYNNRNQFGGRIGGPIIRNQTHFFLLYEGQRNIKRENAVGTTLTDMARQGIFRYFPGVQNNHAASDIPTVDRLGNPLRPANATGDLAAIDLFGNCTFDGAPVANCRTFRDPLRPAISGSAYMQETLRRMPPPNDFAAGDGLNTARIRFTRRVEGLDLANGNGTDVNRDQYNARIDHQFSASHRLSIVGTREKNWAFAAQAGVRQWPDGFDGLQVRRPDVYTITLTSTLSPTILNTLRAGQRKAINLQYGAPNRPDAVGAEAMQFVPMANGVPFRPQPQLWTSFVLYGGFGRWREHHSPMYMIGDDVSWTRGQHAFKGGFELRHTASRGFGDPQFTPQANFGAGNNPITGLDATAFTGLVAQNATLARNLLTDLTASIASVGQAFGIASAQDTTLRGSPEIPGKFFVVYQREMGAYFKDDWKVTSNLTLNLGARWDWYGQPVERMGVSARIAGNDESALTNVTCTSSPGTIGFISTCSNLTQVQFVGKYSTNPDLNVNLKGDDNNNFAPAVGFAWNVPWFTRNTVLRGGYSISYLGALRNFITVDSVLGTVPGINVVSGGTGLQWEVPTGQFTDVSTLTLPIPFPTGQATSSPFLVPTTDRTLNIQTYDRVSPYIQNWNLEIQRELARNTTVEVRYIGTKGTKLWGTLDLNQVDALRRNRELFDAFNAVRGGGESELLNQMLLGLNIGGRVVNGTTWTGANAFRTLTSTRGQIANGNVGAFVNALNTTLTVGTGSADRGAILRRAGFPENYIAVNPQYNQVLMHRNLGNSTYHALQMQLTRRLANGFTNTTTYTWSKSLGEANTDAGATYRDPANRRLEKRLLGFDRAHQITSNGTYELPFGAGRLLGNAPGWVQQFVSRWQLGGILNWNSGGPLDVNSGLTTISTVGVMPNIVGDFAKNVGKVTKVDNGVIYFDGYAQVEDPGIQSITTLDGLRAGYSNRAILAPDGRTVLVNPQPGEAGTLGNSWIKGPSDIRLDVNVIKRFQIDESREFEFRMDAINLLNTPNFGNPNTAINNSNFGRITAASGERTFVLNTRINF